MAVAEVLVLLEILKRLIRAQAVSRQQMVNGAVAAARQRTQTMDDDSWRDAAAITAFAAAMVKSIQPYQRQVAAVTNAFQARMLTEQTGRTVRPVGQVDIGQLRGIPAESVYGRLADGYRYLVSEGKSVAEAQKLTVLRATDVAEMDVQLATRAQSQKVMSSNKKVLYYRRVIHPEKSTSGASCGLCIVASHNTYSKKDLLPIHFRCNCEVVGVTDENNDYGLQINDQDLADIYEWAGSKSEADKLKATRFSVHEHGELGPVLTYRGNRFRGPADVRDDTDTDGSGDPVKPVPLD